MRFVRKSIFLIFLITIMFACDDDTSPLPDDYLSFGKRTIEINRPFLIYSDENTSRAGVPAEVYEHYLVIYSVDFPEMDQNHALIGKGHFLGLQLTSASPDLDTGTYIFDGTFGSPGKLSGTMNMNYFSAEPYEADMYLVSEGTLTVGYSQGMYEINFDGIAENSDAAKKLKVRYTGTTIGRAPL